MRVNNETILEDTDLRLVTYTDVINLDHIYGYSVYILYTGSIKTMKTEAKLQISNDGTNWSDYHTFQLDGAGDNCTINCTEVFYKRARIKLTPGPGTISPTITVYKKGM